MHADLLSMHFLPQSNNFSIIKNNKQDPPINHPRRFSGAISTRCRGVDEISIVCGVAKTSLIKKTFALAYVLCHFKIEKDRQSTCPI